MTKLSKPTVEKAAGALVSSALVWHRDPAASGERLRAFPFEEWEMRIELDTYEWTILHERSVVASGPAQTVEEAKEHLQLECLVRGLT